MAAPQTSSEMQHAYWLAVRGTQQLDLAERFAATADREGFRILALKGISIAQELYGAVENRPMADIDFLVVDTERFAEVAEVARHLGLAETGASDHALVFKEPRSGVVLELHVALTACPGLFPIDHNRLWDRRKPVVGATFQRLCDADLLVHLALHTAFQHGFTANEFHYGDFLRSMETLGPTTESVLVSAGEMSACAALGAMAHACATRFPESKAIRDLALATKPFCPTATAKWIDQWTERTPPLSVTALARVRFQLAPSATRFVRKALLPSAIPGRTLARPTPWRRLLGLLSAVLPSLTPTRQNPS